MTGAGFFATKSEAVTLTVAGTALQAIDYYCSSNTCKNFSDSQKTSPQAILNNLNSGTQNFSKINTAMNDLRTYYGGQAEQSSYRTTQGTAQTSSYSQFIVNLKSFVSNLAVFLPTLKASDTKKSP
jgi:hypothetical protein